jgi:hypothetical protein
VDIRLRALDTQPPIHPSYRECCDDYCRKYVNGLHSPSRRSSSRSSSLPPQDVIEIPDSLAPGSEDDSALGDSFSGPQNSEDLKERRSKDHTVLDIDITTINVINDDVDANDVNDVAIELSDSHSNLTLPDSSDCPVEHYDPDHYHTEHTEHTVMLEIVHEPMKSPSHKHPLQDSAYQSKEQSTDQCNSVPVSTTVSPTQLSTKKSSSSSASSSSSSVPVLYMPR